MIAFWGGRARGKSLKRGARNRIHHGGAEDIEVHREDRTGIDHEKHEKHEKGIQFVWFVVSLLWSPWLRGEFEKPSGKMGCVRLTYRARRAAGAVPAFAGGLGVAAACFLSAAIGRMRNGGFICGSAW